MGTLHELGVWGSLPASTIGLQPEGLGSNLSSATYCCVTEQVSSCLWASVSSSV